MNPPLPPTATARTILIFSLLTAGSQATTIDFEGLPDLTPVGSTYSAFGLSLTGATAITSGLSLNEFEFPPKSGSNVVFDDGGPISGEFATPVTSLGAYLTHAQTITLSLYSAGGSLIATVTSASTDNLPSTGGSPNEFLSYVSAVGIKSFSFSGSSIGESFTLDDLTFDTSSTVPESGSSLAALAVALTGIWMLSRLNLRAL